MTTRTILRWLAAAALVVVGWIVGGALGALVGVALDAPGQRGSNMIMTVPAGFLIGFGFGIYAAVRLLRSGWRR